MNILCLSSRQLRDQSVLNAPRAWSKRPVCLEYTPCVPGINVGVSGLSAGAWAHIDTYEYGLSTYPQINRRYLYFTPGVEEMQIFKKLSDAVTSCPQR